MKNEINKLLSNYKKIGNENFKKLKNENFNHGLNIKVEPNNFSFDDIIIEDKIETNIKSNEIKEINLFLKKEFDNEKTKIDYFNQANLSKLTYLKLSKNDKLKDYFIQIKENKNFVHYIFILAEEGFNGNVFISNYGKSNYFSQEVRVILKKNSSLKIFNFNNLSNKTTYFDKKYVIEEENVNLSLNDICIGGLFSRYESNTHLNGIESKIFQRGLYLIKENQKVDISYNAFHKSKKTFSDLITKGALVDNSIGLSRSLIKIGKNASDSIGYELQEALILNDGAQANAIPKLEILNPNVKCSHGSTIGQINKEEIFYLMSRGLTKKEAKKLIINSYFSSLLNQMFNNEEKNNELKEEVINLIEMSVN